MIPYNSPETKIISLTEEYDILGTSMTIDDWTNDGDSIDF